MARRQDIDVGLLAFIGVVSAMLLLMIVWGVQAWFAYESDRLTEIRYAHDLNVEFNQLKVEQYANIGDTVGNQTIYGGAPHADPAEQALFGFRFVDEERQQLAIPIHLAMAQIVRQQTGVEVDVEELRRVDRQPLDVMRAGHATPVDAVEAGRRIANQHAPEHGSANPARGQDVPETTRQQ